MAAGKNKLLRWTRIYVGGYNLSGDARTIGNLMAAYGAAEMTGWSDGVKNYLPDYRLEVGISGFRALMNDTALSGAYTVLKAAAQSLPVSVLLGSLAEPVAGDAAYLLAAAQLKSPMGWEGQAAAIGGDFVADATQIDANSVIPHADVFSPEASIAVTTNGTIIDNGAASTAGAHANLHLTASSGGTWVFTIKQSATGAFAGEETTLMTFTANGSAVTAEHKSVAGSVARYLRFVATRTSGSVTPVCVLARN